MTPQKPEQRKNQRKTLSTAKPLSPENPKHRKQKDHPPHDPWKPPIRDWWAAFWVNLQAQYDLAMAERELGAQIAKEVEAA